MSRAVDSAAAVPKRETIVYILRCADGTLYTGWTNDFARRMAAHNTGHGAKYTRSRLPAVPVYTEPCATRGDALRREMEIKALPRAKKLALICAADARAHP